MGALKQVTSAELIGKQFVPLKVVDGKVPVELNLYGSPNKVLPAEIVLINITKYTKDIYHMQYYADGKELTVNVPAKFAFKVPGKALLKKITKKYQDYVLANLDKKLGYSGTLGSDPEIFVEDDKNNLIPAFKFLGSKAAPTKGPNRSYGDNNCYWDGFQAEFDTKAMECAAWQIDSIQCGLEGVYKAAKKFNKNAKLSVKTVAHLPPEMLNEAAQEHVEFGCMPSFNAYGMVGDKRPGREVFYRTAGGHVHFGPFQKVQPDDYVKIVKALDAILGVACVSLFDKYDNPMRRQMYGLAGEYRLPPHGLEYRVLSNAWLFHPLLTNIVMDLGRKAFAFGQKNLLENWNATEEETINVINNHDVRGARRILRRNKKLFVKIINASYGYDSKTAFVYKLILKGMDSVIKDPTDIAGNWNLGGEWTTHCEGQGKNINKAFDKKIKV